MPQIFNGPAFFIVLREVLEACLIVALLLATLAKTGATHLRRYVWLGTAAGVLISLTVGIALTVVFYSRGEQVFSDKAEKIFEGIAFIVAAALLVWVGIWTRSSTLLVDGLRRSVERVLDAENEADAEVARKGRRRASLDYGAGAPHAGNDEETHGYLADDEVGGSDGEAGEGRAVQPGVQVVSNAASAAASTSGSSDGGGKRGLESHQRHHGVPPGGQARWRRRRKKASLSAADRSSSGSRGGGPGGGMSFRSGSGSMVPASQGRKGWLSAETKTKFGIALVAFIHVLREGIETFIFVFGASQADSRAEWKGVLLPSALALIVGIAIAFTVVRGMATVNIGRMLAISGTILLTFAAGLASHGFHELSEAEWFGTWGDKPLERDWWNATMWSTKGCCDDTTNEFFALLRALFGYQDQPTFIEVSTYFAFLFFLMLGLLYLERARVVKARNRTARLARFLSVFHLPVFFVGFVFSLVNPAWTGIVVCSLGLVLSVSAVFVTHDLLANSFVLVKSARRMIALGTGLGVALLGVFVVALHIVQSACLGETCELPAFFYWGLIFSGSWLASAREETSWVPLGVLSVSLVVSVFSIFAFSVALILFSAHVDDWGDYVYAKERIKAGAVEGVFDEDVDDASMSLEPSVAPGDTPGDLERPQLGLTEDNRNGKVNVFSPTAGKLANGAEHL